MPWLIDKFTKYVSESMYVSIHCFKIDAGISSFPGAEFFNVLITVMISFFWYIDTMDISVYVRQWIYCACYLLSKTFPYIYKVVVKTICNLVFVYS